MSKRAREESDEVNVRFDSKNPNISWLSNLTTYSREDGTEGNVEKLYHRWKLVYSIGDAAKKKALGDAIMEAPSGKDAKKLGGKGAFKKYKLQLNVVEWDARKVDIMRDLLNHRAHEDARFRDILVHFVQAGKTFVHKMGRGAVDTTGFAEALNELGHELVKEGAPSRKRAFVDPTEE